MDDPVQIAPAYSADALVRVPEICRNSRTGKPGILPISRSTWYAWVKQGIAPKGMQIGNRTVVWRLADIQALAKVAQSDA